MSLKQTRNIFFGTLLLLLTTTAFASGPSYYGIIQEIDGVAFVTAGDRTVEAREGMRVFDHSEIMTTAGSQVTFMDRYDHLFHLASSGHVKVNNQIVSLKRGYLWFQSMRQTNDSFALETANSQVIYERGEGILSFDESSGKSQVLAIKGHFLFGNTIQEHFVERIREGEFSYIEDSYQAGMPRRPTSVGYNSYQSVTSLFLNVEPLQGELYFPEMQEETNVASTTQNAPRSRTIASVGTTNRPQGQIKFVRAGFTEVDKSKLRDYYRSQLKTEPSSTKDEKSKEKKPTRSVASVKQKEHTPQYSRKSGVPVRVFGVQSSSRTPSSTAQKPDRNTREEARKPASMTTLNPQVQISGDAFEQGLSEEYQRQQRHSDEVNALIRDLKTYDRDFKISY